MSKRAPDQPCGTSESPSVYFMQWIHQLRAGISSSYQTRHSPKLKRHPHKSFPLPHDHRIDPRWRCKRLSSAPYHNNYCIALTTFGKEVHKTGFTDRAETCSDEEDIRLDAFLKSNGFFWLILIEMYSKCRDRCTSAHDVLPKNWYHEKSCQYCQSGFDTRKHFHEPAAVCAKGGEGSGAHDAMWVIT